MPRGTRIEPLSAAGSQLRPVGGAAVQQPTVHHHLEGSKQKAYKPTTQSPQAMVQSTALFSSTWPSLSNFF